MATQIHRGSISRLHKYETCPRQAYFAYVEKIPEPPRPALPAGKEYPNDRGTRVHNEIENYVRKNGEAPYPKEAKKFEREHIKLADLFAAKRATMEDPWYFNDSWVALKGPTAEKEYTFQVRLDVSVTVDDVGDHMAVIDHKTGRRYGNEVKHADQMRMYALGTFLRYEPLKVTTELHYLDHDEISDMTYNYNIVPNLIANYSRRFHTMFEDKVFRPKPNAWNCSYCVFKTGRLGKSEQMGTGHCRLNP